MRALLLLALCGCAQYRLTYAVPAEDTGADSAPADTAPADTAPADSAGDSGRDTGEAPDTTEPPPTPAACARILVYSTDPDGRALARFAGLPDTPGLARFELDLRERGTDGRLDAALLADYSQLWLLGTDPALGATLDFDELRAIRDFVDTNAGLLLVGGPEDDARSYADDVATVADLYGLRMEESVREGADGAPLPVTDADPALMDGVATLPGFAAVAALTPTDPAVRVAGVLGGAPALAARDDLRVVFDRSWEGWTDAWRGVGDQATLVGNIAERLEACAP